MSRTDRIWLTILFAANVCGCTTQDTLSATEVINHGNCQTLESGVSRVNYEDVAKIRGSRLIGGTVTEHPRNPPDLLLLAISRGEQPTPGYRLSLIDAYLERETAVIEFFWAEPEAAAVLPQVTTHPCIVVGLQTGPFRNVRAIDQRGNRLGELAL
ncbi:MAG: protease complex subunit PrcB family protein [Gammaproteobacteria bacterium]|nr:protease complex subunit PrcB family protein [Gammaproteobacteria bacterium]